VESSAVRSTGEIRTMGNTDIVRRLMAATITDTKFLQGLKILWRDNLAGPDWQWLARECFSYLDSYGVAPGRNIELIWASAKVDDEARAELEDLLSGLSDEYEREDKLNTEELLSEAERYFACEHYADLAAMLEAAADAGDLDKLKKLTQEDKPPTLVRVSISNPFTNPGAMAKALESKQKPLVDLGGALQEMLGDQILPDSLIGLGGYKKVGKTWFTQMIGFGGMRVGSNVLFVQCGDLSEAQQYLRWAIQISGLPSKEKYAKARLSPVIDCLLNQDDTCDRAERVSVTGCIEAKGKPYPKFKRFEDIENDYKPCTACSHFKPSSWWERVPEVPLLTPESIDISCRRISAVFGDRLRFVWYNQGESTWAKIDAVQQRLWDYEGWKAHITIPDYLDIFGPEPGAPKEFRHQENARWSAARKYSQKWECSVIAPTQANRPNGNRRILRPKDISEDDRKFAHCTDMFGLNKDDHDKRRGWLRINPLGTRDDESTGWDQVAVLQFLQRGCPNLGSFWYMKEEE